MAEVAASGKSVTYLFWVGCAAALDARNQKIARSVVKILEAAGVSFAVLGTEEQCNVQVIPPAGSGMNTSTKCKPKPMSQRCHSMRSSEF